MDFKKIPRDQLDMRRRHAEAAPTTMKALMAGLETARRRGHASKFSTIEPVIEVGELWADRDALRAALIGDTIPPAGTEYVLAIVPADRKGLDPSRWYVLPSATSGTTPLRIAIVVVDKDHYSTLEREGWKGLLDRTVAELEAVGGLEQGGGSTP